MKEWFTLDKLCEKNGTCRWMNTRWATGWRMETTLTCIKRVNKWYVRRRPQLRTTESATQWVSIIKTTATEHRKKKWNRKYHVMELPHGKSIAFRWNFEMIIIIFTFVVRMSARARNHEILISTRHRNYFMYYIPIYSYNNYICIILSVSVSIKSIICNRLVASCVHCAHVELLLTDEMHLRIRICMNKLRINEHWWRRIIPSFGIRHNQFALHTNWICN